MMKQEKSSESLEKLTEDFEKYFEKISKQKYHTVRWGYDAKMLELVYSWIRVYRYFCFVKKIP